MDYFLGLVCLIVCLILDVESQRFTETRVADVMNQIEGALTGNYLVRNKVSRMTQLSHELCISQVTNTC